MNCSLRPVASAQRAQLERLTAATGVFHPDEVATAVELLDESVDGDDDYRFVGAYDGERLVGYACWGPTPGTRGTADLYWIVVDPAAHGRGIGTTLLAEVERRLEAERFRLLVAETSSRADYIATRTFYEHRGFRAAATIPAYYAPGDDLVIYLKELGHGVLARTPS